MLRLRTTTGLSALALAVGIAGTGWLSGLTSVWSGAPARYAAQQNEPTQRPSRHRRHAMVPVVQHRQRVAMADADAVQAAPVAPPATLQPLATPPDDSAGWEQLRGHLDGQVIVSLRVDGEGRVERASVARSSGDPVLDAHALRSVRGWRFAVPPGHPDGLNGELPMRFSSQDRRLGML